jgi:subtilisin family serine protease
MAGGRFSHLLTARRRRRVVAVLVAATLPVPVVALSISSAPGASADEATVTLLVQVDPSMPADEQDLVVDSGTEVSVIESLGLHEVVVDAASAPAVLDSYNGDELVVSASVDVTRQIDGTATDPDYSSQWALPKIGWEEVHGEVTFAGTATLAVLDTGVDASAPDLAGRLVPGWSFDGSDPGVDPNGHGTHTATIAAASADDGVGIAGVADTATAVMPVKVLGADGSGSDSDVIAGLVWATDHGADVAVMPFSAAGYSEALQAAIDYAWASGVIIVAAAGNDGSSTPRYPAGNAKVVGVGATTQDDSLWAASNQSDAIFLSAPGVDVLASDATGSVNVTGTSASAALVAGAAASLRAIDPAASNAMIVGRLAGGADPLSGATLGNGRVDLGAASAITSEDGLTPLGAPDGGPYVGPFITAVARTWTGAGSTNFNNGGNWSPAGVPSALDALTIPGSVPSGNYPLVSTGTGNALAASIVIQSGASLTVTGSTLAVSGIITNQAGGTLSVSNTGEITVPNNIVNDGTFLIFGLATVTIPHDYLGTGTATMTQGTMSIGRNWRPTAGSFTATGGTVRFTGLADSSANFAGATNQFANIVVDATANPRFSWTPGSEVNIGSNFTNANPTLTTTANATFTFNGSATQFITSASAFPTFGNVVVNKPGSTLALSSDAFVSGDLTLSAGRLDLQSFRIDRAVSLGGTISAANGTILEIGGTHGFPGGYLNRVFGPTSQVFYDGTNQAVGAATYGHLTLTGGGTKVMPAAPLNVAGNLSVMAATATAAGPITVDGSAMFSPASVFDAGSFTHRVRGNFAMQSSSWNGATSTFVFDGSAVQTVSGIVATVFNNLTIDNPSGISLAMGIQIAGGGAGGLHLLDGNITTNASAVTIRAGGAVHHTSGHVVGLLRKQIASDGTVGHTYEVGTATSYTPVTVDIHGVTGSGSGQQLGVRAVAGEHPDVAASGIAASKDVNVHWTTTQSGTWTFTDYDATFGFEAGDVDAGADTAQFVVRRNTGGSWFAAPAGTRTATSTQSTGNTSFSDFVVGEPSGDATTTTLTCPASLTYGSGGLCTAVVTTSIPGVAPSGSVSFTTDGAGAFTPSASCALVPQTTTSSSCSVTYTPTAVGSGTHQIDASFTDGVAYQSSSSGPEAIAVGAAPLVITPADQSKVYGSFDPVFTFTYSGLVNGDVATAVAPTCTVTGPHATVSGSPYPITCSGASDPDYAISYVDGELTVTTAALVITGDDQSKVYGSFDPVFTFTYSGLANGDLAPAVVPTCTVLGPHDTVAGSPYPIECSGASDPNYTIAYVDGELEVTPANLTITADDQSKVYGSSDPTFTFTYSGLVNGDVATALAPTCAVVGPHEAVAGSPYPIECSGAVDSNYAISYADGELAVTPAPLVITADDQSKVAGSFDPVFTFTYSGLVNGDLATAVAPTCTVVGPHDTVVGSPYPITCSGAVDANYAISYVDGELTVTPPPTVPEVVSITRADPDPTNAATVSWTVTFTDPVTGVDVGDFSLDGAGAVGASVTSVSADTGATRTVIVATGASGTLALHLDDDDSISDGLLTPLGGTGTGTVASGGTGNGSFAGEAYTVDKQGPVIVITTPASGATYAIGQVVNAAYTCSDDAGVGSCTGTVANGAAISTTPVGTKTFTVNASDSLGNTSTLSTTYSVGFAFTGFFAPVDNLPVLNSIKAGQAVPVKFSLGGDYGLGIFMAGYPKSQQIPCDSTALVDGVEETVTAGASSLTYDAGTDRYHYVWKTPKTWQAGTCRQLVVKFVDGTTRHANFKIK